jgi:hypothetical protein
MAEAFSESLAYPQVKKRAVASRSFRTKITPSNGSTFTGGNTINLDLPGNLAGQYYNPNQMYLKFKVQNSVAAVQFDRAGAVGCIKRIQIQTAGAQLYDCNNWNVLATALMDTDCSADWKASSGSILMGTQGDQLQGEALGAAAARTYCVPMMLNPLSMTTPHRLIPAFSLSALQFRITLENDTIVGKTGTLAAPGAPVFTYSDVEMVCLMTELSPGAQSQIDSMTGGQYNILANSYLNSQATLAAGVSSLTANLGISVSSLERILVVHRPSASATAAGAFSLGNRTTSGLTEFQFLINSENYPQRPILVDGKGAESYAELLIADHALVDFRKGNCILNSFVRASAAQSPALTNPLGSGALSGNAPGVVKNDCFRQLDGLGDSAGTNGVASVATNSNVGTFVAACEFESGLSDGKSSHIYSGISTIASVVQYKGTYEAHAAANVDFFAQHTIMISLDMRGSGVYAVSV